MYKTSFNSKIGKLTLVSDGKFLLGLFIENQKYFLNGFSNLIENNNLEIFIETKE